MPNSRVVINKANRSVRVEQTFLAPIEKLWQAHTQKELIQEWWGPFDATVYVEDFDVRQGSRWRVEQTEPDGTKITYFGDFIQVQEHQLIEFTFDMVGKPDHILTREIRFEIVDDNLTKVISVSRYTSLEDLQKMIESDIEKESQESFEKLANLVEK